MKSIVRISLICLVTLASAVAVSAQSQDEMIRYLDKQNRKDGKTTGAEINALLRVGRGTLPASGSFDSSRVGAPANPLIPTDASGLPTEVGVYFTKHQTLAEIEPERITWQTGGVMKAWLTEGIVKGDINGVVRNARSPVTVGQPMELIVRCREGESVAEFQLIQFREKGDRREFRLVTGGVFHRSSGAKRDDQPLLYEKIAPRTYRVMLGGLEHGEYGLLAPGAQVSATAASIGKAYTFSIE